MKFLITDNIFPVSFEDKIVLFDTEYEAKDLINKTYLHIRKDEFIIESVDESKLSNTINHKELPKDLFIDLESEGETKMKYFIKPKNIRGTLLRFNKCAVYFDTEEEVKECLELLSGSVDELVSVSADEDIVLALEGYVVNYKEVAFELKNDVENNFGVSYEIPKDLEQNFLHNIKMEETKNV